MRFMELLVLIPLVPDSLFRGAKQRQTAQPSGGTEDTLNFN